MTNRTITITVTVPHVGSYKRVASESAMEATGTTLDSLTEKLEQMARAATEGELRYFELECTDDQGNDTGKAIIPLAAFQRSVVTINAA